MIGANAEHRVVVVAAQGVQPGGRLKLALKKPVISGFCVPKDRRSSC
jgi:hypothetical protein